MSQTNSIQKYKIHEGYIKTITGRNLDPITDKPDFSIVDIAWAAAMCVRFNGHVNRFYSIAEHGLLVAAILAKRHPGIRLYTYEGLMHDAIESYLSDVPSPFKVFLPDYVEFDSMLDTKLRRHFHVPAKTKSCKEADWIALFIEGHALLPNRGEHFSDPLGLRPYALTLLEEFPLVCCPPPDKDRYIYEQFLNTYEALRR